MPRKLSRPMNRLKKMIDVQKKAKEPPDHETVNTVQKKTRKHYRPRNNPMKSLNVLTLSLNVMTLKLNMKQIQTLLQMRPALWNLQKA